VSIKDQFKDRIKSKPMVHDALIDTTPEETKKQNFEDRFVRKTVYIDKEMFKLLDERAKSIDGGKTRIVNEALDLWFRSEQK
jgi:hypothetical protein